MLPTALQEKRNALEARALAELGPVTHLLAPSKLKDSSLVFSVSI